MRIKAVNQSSMQTNAATQSTEFKIGNTERVVDLLRNRLYSKPIQTLVQEYLSNARDAHREAGSDRPMQVTLPSYDEPTIIIRDFGPGMSPERVREVFCQYGVTTKAESDTQIGGFGIGAKSAWAYTDSFAVVSYHEGKAYHYVLHTAKTAIGSMDLVKETTTIEPNGVEIQIPVKGDDLKKFQLAAERATMLWAPEEFPKFNGGNEGQPNSVYTSKIVTLHESKEVSALGFEEKRYGNQELFVCVDGIPYPLPKEYEKKVKAFTERFRDKIVPVLHFGSAEIEVSATREAISLSDANEKAIVARAHDAAAKILEFIMRPLKASKTLREFLTVHRAFADWYVYDVTVQFRGNGHTFGVEADGCLILPEAFRAIQETEYSLHARSERLDVGRTRELRVAYPHRNAVWTDDETSTANQNRRAKAKIQADGLPKLMILSALPGSPQLREFASMLGIPGTSSLGPASIRTVIKRDAEGDVIINVYEREGAQKTSAKVVRPESSPVTYVYVIRKTENASATNSESKPLARLVKAAGLCFCLVSEANAKRLEGKPKFLSETEFFEKIDTYLKANTQVEQMLYRGVLSYVFNRGSEARRVDVPNQLIQRVSELKDPILRSGLKALTVIKGIEKDTQRFHSSSDDLRIDEFKDLLFKNSKALAQFRDETSALRDAVRSTYPLIQDACGGWNSKPSDDLFFYANAKFKALKG
jgi:hypothetical protein